jgi:hypothetical protein
VYPQPQTSANGFLTSGLVIHEHHIGMDLLRQRDRRALARVELPHYGAVLRTPNLHPIRSISCPILNRFRRKRMLQLSQYSSWNENSCV